MGAVAAGGALASMQRLQALHAERDLLLDRLRVVLEVGAQGVDVDNGVKLGWSSALVPEGVRRLAELAAARGKAAEAYPWAGELSRRGGSPGWYNYWVREDGTRVPLAVYVQAARA